MAKVRSVLPQLGGPEVCDAVLQVSTLWASSGRDISGKGAKLSVLHLLRRPAGKA